MVTLCQITMDCGDGIVGSTIKWNLQNNAKHFDRVIVVDGKLTDKAKEFYSQFRNVEYIDSPWKDSYVDQYRAFANKLKDDEWCLYLDCDEIPSSRLLLWTKEGMSPQLDQNTKCNMFYLPCVLHITEDGKRYYPVENFPDSDFHDQWTKHILFKKRPSLDFQFFGSHVISTHGKQEIPMYVSKPYYHMKSLESFVENDCWQAFLLPEGQGYNAVESAKFRMLIKQYKTTKEFKLSVLEGTWSEPLKKFALDHIHENNRPISRLAWNYFILAGNCRQTKQEIPSWEEVSQYVLGKESMDLLRQNKEKGNYLEL